MPYRRTFRRTSYRKRRPYGRKKFVKKFNKYGKSKSSKLVLNRSLPGGIVFPDIYRCKLWYSQDFHLTGGGIENLKIAGNSLWDPDKYSGGYHPVYYAQLSGIYENYRVLGSKIIINIMAGSTSLTYLVSYPDSLSAAVSDMRSARAQPYAKFCNLTGNAAQGKSVVKNFVTTKKMYGVPRVTQEVNFQGKTGTTLGTDPTNIWYWHNMISTVDSGAKNVWINLKVVYYAQFENRYNLDQTEVPPEEEVLNALEVDAVDSDIQL